MACEHTSVGRGGWTLSLKPGVTHVLDEDWPDVVRAEAEVGQGSALTLSPIQQLDDEPPALGFNRLDYIRRYGSVMGMCMYELDCCLSNLSWQRNLPAR